MPGRVAKQCRERYLNHLDDSLRRGPWSPEEEAELVTLCQRYRGQWAEVCRLLPGRAYNDIKNHYNLIQRRTRRLERRGGSSKSGTSSRSAPPAVSRGSSAGGSSGSGATVTAAAAAAAVEAATAASTAAAAAAEAASASASASASGAGTGGSSGYNSSSEGDEAKGQSSPPGEYSG
jgi:Myb-like DNA-binding domain